MTEVDALGLLRPQSATPESSRHADMVWIPGGTFRMGSDKHYAEEAPVHSATVDAFWIDRTPVTNRQFREFVRATGHVTFAEIDELRMMDAMNAQAYWQTMREYDPTLSTRMASELYQCLMGQLPRPSIYENISDGEHLLIRSPSVLYLIAWADESGPPAIAAWQAWRAAHGTPAAPPPSQFSARAAGRPLRQSVRSRRLRTRSAH